MDSTGAGRMERSRTWPEYAVIALGVVYLLVGALGFAVTGGMGFASRDGGELLGVFEVNPLHNIAHLAIGAALVGAYLSGRRAVIAIAAVVGAVYLLLAVVGPFVVGTDANILALNAPDHWLHLGSAIVLLLAAYTVRMEDRAAVS